MKWHKIITTYKFLPIEVVEYTLHYGKISEETTNMPYDSEKVTTKMETENGFYLYTDDERVYEKTGANV